MKTTEAQGTQSSCLAGEASDIFCVDGVMLEKTIRENVMKEKSKRKNSYRRWRAFRGLILTLIVFMVGIGYFLTHLPEYEEIVYLNDGNLYRISLALNAEPELLADFEYDIVYFLVNKDFATLYSGPIHPYFRIALGTLQIGILERPQLQDTPLADNPRIGAVTSENRSYRLGDTLESYGRITMQFECKSETLKINDFTEQNDSHERIDPDFNMNICRLPLWNQDGVHVVLVQGFSRDTIRLILYNVESQEIDVLMEDVRDIYNLADWNKDNTAFLFTLRVSEGQREIWLYDMNRHQPRYLAEGYLPLFAD